MPYEYITIQKHILTTPKCSEVRDGRRDAKDLLLQHRFSKITAKSTSLCGKSHLLLFSAYGFYRSMGGNI